MKGFGRKKDRKKDTLRSVVILVADADVNMADVLIKNLTAMGFGKPQLVKNGEEVLAALKEKPCDMLITEWPMSPVDGIELVKKLRSDRESPSRMMPILMITGRGEKTDVETARDAGITEFVIKPFSASTVYSRLEEMIERPRGFLLSSNYVGPDRRRRESKPTEERRKSPPSPIQALTLSPSDDYASPKIIPPDHSLKRKLALTEPLSNIITPEVLQEAQSAIDSLADESLTWVKNDMTQLEAAYKRLADGDINALKTLKDAALSIKSRAGTFGYHLTSEVARLLYRFATVDYKPGVGPHNNVVQKHIEALKIIVVRHVTGKDSDASQEITRGLEMLVSKYRDAR